nr:GntR family transcriptional regulator [Ectobacillus ponti]
MYEQIYHSLEESILTGGIAAGERLIDTRIAAEFGVSRSPVREAFRKLEGDGLLTNHEGIVTVFTPSLQDVLELYQVRVGLESVAAYWAAVHAMADELRRLQDLLGAAERAVAQQQRKEIISLNTQFHELIVSSSRNARLSAMMYHIRSLVRLCRNTIIQQYNRGDSFLSEHYGIYHALQARNPELAAERMQEHMYRDMQYFQQSYLGERESLMKM